MQTSKFTEKSFIMLGMLYRVYFVLGGELCAVSNSCPFIVHFKTLSAVSFAMIKCLLYFDLDSV